MKNFVSVNLTTYSKEHLEIILKHNIERKTLISQFNTLQKKVKN